MKDTIKKAAQEHFNSCGIAKKYVYLIYATSSGYYEKHFSAFALQKLKLFAPPADAAADKRLLCSYGNIKDVFLRADQEEFVTAHYCTNKNYGDLSEFRNYNFVKDFIRKMYIASIIYGCGKHQNFDTIVIDKISSDGIFETACLKCDDGQKVMHSLLSGSVKLPCVSKPVLEKAVSLPVSKYDADTAMLFSYIIGKAKDNETEKFLYLYKAFNAMYSKCFSKLFAATEKDKKEFNKLKCFAKHCGYGKYQFEIKDKTEREEKERLVRIRVEQVCRKTFSTKNNNAENAKKIIQATAEFFSHPDDKFLGLKKIDFDAEAYFLLNYIYHVRNNLFHAEKPAVLLAFPDDTLLFSLTSLNTILETFLDLNFENCFTDKFDKIAKIR